MTRMLQIRNVPDDVHRELKARAARAGMTLTDYLLREVTRVAQQPSVEEVLERIRAQPQARLSETPAEAVRAERQARG
jgi:plasmid stability protein